MTERERLWGICQSDPRWLEVRRESERAGLIVANIASSLLRPVLKDARVDAAAV